MSPHVEYWGILLPDEELPCAPETKSPIDGAKTAGTRESRLSNRPIECSGEETDFALKPFE